MDNLKQCTKCMETKPTTAFNKDLKARLKVSNRCKQCTKKYRDSVRCRQLIYLKKYREQNKARKKELDRNYYLNNKDRIQKYRNEYTRKRLIKDPLFKLAKRIRTSIYKVFKNLGIEKEKTERLLGSSFEETKVHIEKQFQPGMTWENYGEWHIDHIVPLASAKTEEDLYRLCHYTNLQPLWAIDNLRKGAKHGPSKSP